MPSPEMVQYAPVTLFEMLVFPPPPPPISFQAFSVYSSMPPAPLPAPVSVITLLPGFTTAKGLDVWNAMVWPVYPCAPSTFNAVNTPLIELNVVGCAFRNAVMGDLFWN